MPSDNQLLTEKYVTEVSHRPRELSPRFLTGEELAWPTLRDKTAEDIVVRDLDPVITKVAKRLMKRFSQEEAFDILLIAVGRTFASVKAVNNEATENNDQLAEDINDDEQKIVAAGWEVPNRVTSGTSAHIPPYKKNGKFLFRDWIRNTWIVQQAPGFGAAWHSFDTLEDALASEAETTENLVPPSPEGSTFQSPNPSPDQPWTTRSRANDRLRRGI